MNDSGVYLIKCAANDTVYVGSSHELRERRRYHFSCLSSGRHWNPRMQAAWNKYGSSSFSFEILQPVSDRNHLLAVEQTLLDYYRSLNGDRVINVALSTTSPMRGRKHSTVALAKQSAVKTGKRHSVETLSKMIESAKTARANPDEKARRSQASKRRWSDACAREAHRLSYKNTKIPITGINHDTGEIVSFGSMAEAQLAGFSRGRIKKAIVTSAVVNGFHWCVTEKT